MTELLCDWSCINDFVRYGYIVFGIVLGITITKTIQWHKQGQLIWNKKGLQKNQKVS